MEASIKTAIAAIRDGVAGDIRQIIESSPRLLERYGSNMLCHAAETNRIDMLQVLVSFGVDPNAPRLSDTLLTSALEEDAMEAASWLLDHGADIDARASDRDSTPLHRAIRSGKADQVRFLLDRGADPEITDGNPARNALAAARFWDEEEIVRLLQSRGCIERAANEPPPIDVESPNFRQRDVAYPEQWYEKKWWHVYDYAIRQGFTTLGQQNRVFFLVGYLVDQVLSGGVESFYVNPSASYATETVEALRAI